jgi:hypothetical protein
MECEAERTMRIITSGREAAERRMVGISQESVEELYLFRQRLEAVAALGCYYCYVTGQVRGPEHRRANCPLGLGKMGSSEQRGLAKAA